MITKIGRIIVLFILILLPTNFSDCKKEPNEKDYYIVDVSQESDWDYWVVGKEGASYCINLEDIKHPFLYYKPLTSETGYTIFLDEYGRPSKVYIDNYIFIFENFTKNTVDIASISPDGTIKLFRNHAIDYDLISVSTKGIHISTSLSDWFNTVGKAISVASCEIGIITAEATIGLGTALGCGVLALDLWLASLPAENEVLKFSTTAAGAAIKTAKCIDGASCVAGLMSEGFAVASAATQSIEINSARVNVAIVQLWTGLEVTTNQVTDFSSNSASVGGIVTSDNGSYVTERGVYWGTAQDPVTTGTKLQIGVGTGSFITTLTELAPYKSYYIVAYALNSEGPAYGSQVSFTTTSSDGQTGTVNDIEGNIYKTISIGSQVWMAENLKTTRFNDGTIIPLKTDSAEWAGLNSPGFCWLNNDEASYRTIYGALYNWFAVNTGNLCPAGWSVPTISQWTTLIEYLAINGYGYEGSGDDIGKSMAATTGWAENQTTGTIGNDQASNNRSGFSALPGGMRFFGGSFDNNSIGYEQCWWLSNQYSATEAWFFFTFNHMSYMDRDRSYKQFGFPVRCIQN